MIKQQAIIKIILDRYPDTQAVYQFGSYGTESQWPDSDLNLAVLLPVKTSKKVDFWEWIEVSNELATSAGVQKVDLINLREVSTVFRKEIIAADRRIHCADEYAADEFEMLTLSFYLKLNEERKEILQSFFETGKAYNV